MHHSATRYIKWHNVTYRTAIIKAENTKRHGPALEGVSSGVWILRLLWMHRWEEFGLVISTLHGTSSIGVTSMCMFLITEKQRWSAMTGAQQISSIYMLYLSTEHQNRDIAAAKHVICCFFSDNFESSSPLDLLHWSHYNTPEFGTMMHATLHGPSPIVRQTLNSLNRLWDFGIQMACASTLCNATELPMKRDNVVFPQMICSTIYIYMDKASVS